MVARRVPQKPSAGANKLQPPSMAIPPARAGAKSRASKPLHRALSIEPGRSVKRPAGRIQKNGAAREGGAVKAMGKSNRLLDRLDRLENPAGDQVRVGRGIWTAILEVTLVAVLDEVDRHADRSATVG